MASGLAKYTGMSRAELVSAAQRHQSTLSNARKKTQGAGRELARVALTGLAVLGTTYSVTRFGDEDEGAKIMGFPAEVVAGAAVLGVGLTMGSKHVMSVGEGIGYAYLAKVGAVLGSEAGE